MNLRRVTQVSTVVGYSSLAENTVKAQYFMLGLPFADCGKTEVDIQKDISTTATIGQYSTRNTKAPRLMYWDATFADGVGAYDNYYYIEDTYDEEMEGSEEFPDGERPGWCDQNGDYLKDVTLPLGSAMWFLCPEETGKTVTISGQVSGEDDLTDTAEVKGYTMFANPFPVALNPNDVTFVMLDAQKKEVGPLAYGQYSSRNNYAPRLMYWDATFAGGVGAYDNYYYIEDTYDEEMEGSEEFPDGERPGWCDQNGDYLKEAVIPAAEGFWMFLPSTTDGSTPAPWINGVRATFTSPLAK